MKFIFLLIWGVVLLSGCQSSLERKIWDNIAEIREFVVYGKENNVTASLTCGKRESEYKINGYATTLVEFGVLTILVDTIEEKELNLTFEMFVGMNKYEGNLIKNPFDETYVADIKKIIDKNENISLSIFLNGETMQSMKLKPIDVDWKLSHNDCVQIVSNKFGKDIKTLIVNNEFEGEVYIKILNDIDKYTSEFYYYFSVVSRVGKSLNIIISPKTGNILASNNTLSE